ncbi:MAG: ornithine cyclodeaminase family protein [Deltaproteobacteria bacterium]|jgi:ornithine cyclodeaminase/alanine dehydrogenase|nr:ornithine cyclodeaminase family protein [Deltaproteobacteria bacterium]
MSNETMLLSQRDIISLITMKEIIESVDKTFQGLGDGTVINPTKVLLNLGETVPWPPYEGYMNAMPAYVGWCDAAGLKWAGGFLGERKKAGLPYITSMILLLDPHVGEFRAVMDGAFITNMRTGAQTAVALKYMYAKGKNIRLGLYGAGVQARTQTMAISELFDISGLLVYDINQQAAETFAEEMKAYVSGKITVVQTPEAASEADVCILVTQAQDSFFQYSWFKPGMFLFPMGSYQECSDECIRKADKIVVDHPGQALHRGALGKLGEAGEISEKTLFATIGELAAGKKKFGAADRNDRVICVPIGTGCMDVGVAWLVWQRAREKGLGASFAFL